MKQSFTNWKLILINDGSTDNSDQSISREILNDPRVTYINDKTNRGLVYRLNQIADLCDTPYLARMDADDMIVPDRIETQLNYLLEHPEVDLVDSALYTIDEDNQVVGIRGMEPISYLPEQIIVRSMLNHATIVGKAGWFKNNKYNGDFLRAEDYELWCRTFTFSNFKRIEKPLYIVREGKVNVKNYILTMRSCRKVLKWYGPRYLSSTRVKREIFKTYMKGALYKITGFFQLQHILTKNRNRQLVEQERLQVQSMITGIIGDNK
ncbi:putative glycosyltransferase EpsE [compost metagenome]